MRNASNSGIDPTAVVPRVCGAASLPWRGPLSEVPVGGILMPLLGRKDFTRRIAERLF